MRVLIDSINELNVDLEKRQVKEWWEKICLEIQKKDRLVYCVSINENLIYDCFDEFIVNNLDHISELNIKTLTINESVHETRNTIDEYLDRFIPAVGELSDSFYGELSDKHWEKFSYFIEGLNWFINSMEFLQFITKVGTSNIETKVLQKLEGIIKDIENATNDQNYVLVGDLMQYEIIPLLENYKTENKKVGDLQ